jgi:phosphotransferase system  glucose/maltose/N-acetylglucosamine-specific IIC component
MKNRWFSFQQLQALGQSLMIPVSVLPGAGLAVALGRFLQLSSSEQVGNVITSPFMNSLGKILYSSGLAIFEQLPVVFAIGVAIGFSGGAGVAGLSAAAAYFTLSNLLKAMSEIRSLPLAINTGVFGGILAGLLAAYLYKKYHETKLHPVLGFFSGKRLVPILSVFFAVVTGLVLSFVWPPIQASITEFGTFITSSSYGPAFYAAGKRLLIPVGLHHVYYPSFLFEFGQFITTTGEVLKGDSPRYFGGDPAAGLFMAAEYPIMLFGLPAAALAMTLRAPSAKRKAIAGIMISAALTSIITGITEPIEFSFIFVAPLLFSIHVVLAFISGLLTHWADLHLGYTFSASLIDFIVGYYNQKNALQLWTVIGPFISILYFSSFYFLIPIFNFKTPGREDDQLDNINADELTSPDSSKYFQILLYKQGLASGRRQ